MNDSSVSQMKLSTYLDFGVQHLLLGQYYFFSSPYIIIVSKFPIKKVIFAYILPPFKILISFMSSESRSLYIRALAFAKRLLFFF